MIATASNTVVATVTIGTNPEIVAITPDGSYAYVANQGSNTASVIATASNTVVKSVTVGNNPRGVAITPNGLRAYVANYLSYTVSLINLLLTQTAPTAASATFGSAYSGQLAVSGNQGTVTYTTTSSNAKLSASSSGALSAPNTTPAGTYTVSGTDDDSAGNNGPWTFTLTVEKAPTTTTLISSTNPSKVGATTTYTATVSPTPTGGTVPFTDEGFTIAGCGAVAVDTSTGKAICQTSYASVGWHSIEAVYLGDSNHLGSESAIVVEAVETAPTTLALASSDNPSTAGSQIVTYTATASPFPDGGSVNFSDEGITIAGCGAVAVDSVSVSGELPDHLLGGGRPPDRGLLFRQRTQLLLIGFLDPEPDGRGLQRPRPRQRPTPHPDPDPDANSPGGAVDCLGAPQPSRPPRGWEVPCARLPALGGGAGDDHRLPPQASLQASTTALARGRPLGHGPGLEAHRGGEGRRQPGAPAGQEAARGEEPDQAQRPIRRRAEAGARSGLASRRSAPLLQGRRITAGGTRIFGGMEGGLGAWSW